MDGEAEYIRHLSLILKVFKEPFLKRPDLFVDIVSLAGRKLSLVTRRKKASSGKDTFTQVGLYWNLTGSTGMPVEPVRLQLSYDLLY